VTKNGPILLYPPARYNNKVEGHRPNRKMKIACLQFAPQVGDIDNNLNRADAILNRAKAADLEELDLLVLPELAFSGTYRNSQTDGGPVLPVKEDIEQDLASGQLMVVSRL
jgi:hypothetical protein